MILTWMSEPTKRLKSRPAAEKSLPPLPRLPDVLRGTEHTQHFRAAVNGNVLDVPRSPLPSCISVSLEVHTLRERQQACHVQHAQAGASQGPAFPKGCSCR